MGAYISTQRSNHSRDTVASRPCCHDNYLTLQGRYDERSVDAPETRADFALKGLHFSLKQLDYLMCRQQIINCF